MNEKKKIICIVLDLVIFFICVIVYLYLDNTNKDNFSSLTVNNYENQNEQSSSEEVYLTQDTRNTYNLLPPVNPNIRKRIIQNSIPSNRDLFTQQDYDIDGYKLDVPPTQNTNQLNYSGGETQMIQIPLQFNDPTNEPLRSQNILITPYNKIKYGNC